METTEIGQVEEKNRNGQKTSIFGPNLTMDELNAPRWVDFNSSMRSDIDDDDFFNASSKLHTTGESSVANFPLLNSTSKSNDTAEERKDKASSGENSAHTPNTNEKYDKNNKTPSANENEKLLALGTLIAEQVKVEKKIDTINDEASLPILPKSDTNSESKDSIVDDDTKEKTRITLGNADKKELSAEERTELKNLVCRLDPPKRSRAEKKNPAAAAAAKPRVLTSQVRRYSGYRRCSGKYIALAEAIAKFQYGTPERFRSKPKTEKNGAGPLAKRVKLTAIKATCAVSPVLLSKLRVRPVAVPSSEKTTTTMNPQGSKKILKKPSSENPTVKKALPNASKSSLPKTSSSAPVNRKIIPTGPKVSSKSAAPAEFKTAATNALKIRKEVVSSGEPKDSNNVEKNGTKLVSSTDGMRKKQVLKKQANSIVRTKPAVTSTAVTSGSEIPKATTTLHCEIKKATNRGKMPSDNLAVVAAAAAAAASSEKIPTKPPHEFSLLIGDKKYNNSSRKSRTPHKKLVTSVVPLNENECGLKDVEILHEGIPIKTQYRNITRPIPFSFETRKKKSNNNKDENNQIQDGKTKKVVFRARPAPSFAKNTLATATCKAPSSTPLKPKNENVKSPRASTAQQ